MAFIGGLSGAAIFLLRTGIAAQVSESEFKAADAALNSAYQECLRVFPSQSKEKLRVAQRAWITFTNKDEAAEAFIGRRAGIAEENLDRETLKEVSARTEQLRSFFVLPNQDINACRRDWQQAEQDLTIAYQSAMALLAPDEQIKLRDAERAWIDYKETNARAHSGDPSGRAPIWAQVLVVRRRTEQFRDFYLNTFAAGRGKTPPVLSGSAIPLASSGTSSSVSSPSPTAPPLEPAVKSRLIADFKEETRDVFSRVTSSTSAFGDITSFDAVRKLPPPVVESIDKLISRARDFRAKLGYEAALHECGIETATVDALHVLNEANESIAAADALAARSQLSTFLQSNPEPTTDEQKPLWKISEVDSRVMRTTGERCGNASSARTIPPLCGQTQRCYPGIPRGLPTFPKPADSNEN